MGAIGETMAPALAPKTPLAVVAGAPNQPLQRPRLRWRSAAPLKRGVRTRRHQLRALTGPLLAGSVRGFGEV